MADVVMPGMGGRFTFPGMGALAATPPSNASLLLPLPVKSALLAQASGRVAVNWRGAVDGSIVADVLGRNGQYSTQTLINAAGKFVTAAGAIADVSAVAGKAVSSLSSLSSMAAIAGPYAGAIAAAAPIVEMLLGGLFSSAPPPPMPSVDGITTESFQRQLRADPFDDRTAELAGRLMADPSGRSLSGKNGPDFATISAVVREEIRATLNESVLKPARGKALDPSRFRDFAILLAQMPPQDKGRSKGAINLLDNMRDLPNLLRLIEYGTPRAALRRALGYLGVVLLIEATEAWSWGRQIDTPRGKAFYAAVRGKGSDCRKSGRRGTGQLISFLFKGRSTGWIGTGGRTDGAWEQELCRQGDWYDRYVALQVLPTVDEIKDEVIYPVPMEVVTQEKAYYQRLPAEIFVGLGGHEFVFGFPSGDRKIDPDINKHSVRPMPDAPDAIDLIFHLAKTVRRQVRRGQGPATFWELANDKIRAQERDILAELAARRDAQQARTKAEADAAMARAAKIKRDAKRRRDAERRRDREALASASVARTRAVAAAGAAAAAWLLFG